MTHVDQHLQTSHIYPLRLSSQWFLFLYLVGSFVIKIFEEFSSQGKNSVVPYQLRS